LQEEYPAAAWLIQYGSGSLGGPSTRASGGTGFPDEYGNIK